MIGIMTYHAAHNYGSVLQAYATQKVLDQYGYDNVIINYRLNNQIQYYNHLYPTFFGYHEFLRSLKRLPEHKARTERNRKFEEFINHRLRLTDRVYHTYSELTEADIDYPILISGSDQLWNKYCTAEFKKEPPESILGYYLAFGREDAVRISISSSFGNSKQDDILEFKEYLEQYDELSVREEDGAQMLQNFLGRNVACTLDPTLMLNSEEWQIEGTYDVNRKYIFVYTLRRKSAVTELLNKIVKKFSDSGCEILCISPFSPVTVQGVKSFAECGPLDFLSYMRSAALIITDSFHGTAFSLNMEVPFYTIEYGEDRRKELLLSKMHQKSRLLDGPSDISSIDIASCFEVDFSDTRTALESERNQSLSYIRNAVGKYYDVKS